MPPFTDFERASYRCLYCNYIVISLYNNLIYDNKINETCGLDLQSNFHFTLTFQ